MAQWGNTDTAADVPLWISSLNKKKETSANRTAAFGNTTANVTGVFVVDQTEAQANPGIAHAGIIARRVGSGGRAGRVQTEVLIAGSTYGTSDASDDTQIPDALIKITAGSPADQAKTTGQATTFVVDFTKKPAAAAATLQWQLDSGGGFANLSNAGVYSGVTTATLAISSVTGLNGMKYRCIITPTAGVAKTSRGATLSVS
jgi:hypothetical protein